MPGLEHARRAGIRGALATGLVLGLTLGCSGDRTTLLDVDPALLPAAEPGARSVLLGTGEAEFEPMEGEPRIRLVGGAQGGFHVWASFLAYGFESTLLDMTLTTTLEGATEGLVMRARLSTREVLHADGVKARSFAGFPAQVRDARCADDRRVTLLLQLSEPGGGAAEDTRSCIAEMDERFRLPDCP